jgi:hypothetical protein
MAADLAGTPVFGIFVQACVYAHLCNFGGFATSERNVIFSINDLEVEGSCNDSTWIKASRKRKITKHSRGNISSDKQDVDRIDRDIRVYCGVFQSLVLCHPISYLII